MQLATVGTEQVWYYPSTRAMIAQEQAVTDLLGEAFSNGATLVALPVDRLPANFFQLRSGLAGAISQKFVTYHLKLAIIGSITLYLAESSALRDWVFECNRGNDLWFLPNTAALVARLTA